MSRRLPSVLTIYCVLLIAFLFAPVIVVVIFSFDAGATGSFPIQGLTLNWYRKFFENPVMVDAAKASGYVALAVTAITIVLGTLAAFALTRYRIRAGHAVLGLIVLPIVLPALLLGISLLSFFDKVGFRLSLWTVIIGQSLITLPFVVLTLNARLAGFDRSLEEAAETLGATPFQTFRHVTFPLIRASVIGAALLVIALSLDEFIVTFFTIGSQNTLPIVIWGQMRAGVSPVVNAVSTLMLTATLVLIVVVHRVTGVRFR